MRHLGRFGRPYFMAIGTGGVIAAVGLSGSVGGDRVSVGAGDGDRLVACAAAASCTTPVNLEVSGIRTVVAGPSSTAKPSLYHLHHAKHYLDLECMILARANWLTI